MAVEIGSGAVSGGISIYQATTAESQADLTAQQQLYTGSGSTLGSVAQSTQGVGENVVSEVATLNQDINAMLAQENQASSYKG
jgi:hypothetical protein